MIRMVRRWRAMREDAETIIIGRHLVYASIRLSGISDPEAWFAARLQESADPEMFWEQWNEIFLQHGRFLNESR